jgi:EpsI family protein
VAIALALVTFAVLQALDRVRDPAISLQSRLQAFPLDLGMWKGTDAGWDSEVVTALGVDDWILRRILRRYQEASGDFVWLYIGFSERVSFSDGHSPHSPLVCYPGQGWELLETDVQEIELPGGRTIAVNKLLVRKGLERRLVLYWQQRGERIALEESWGDYRAKLDWLLRVPSLLARNERTDRALVRISAPVAGTPEATLSREVAFIQSAFPALAQQFALQAASE